MKKQIHIKEVLLSALAVLLVTVFSPIQLYCQNADEASFLEILPVILITGGIGLVLYGVFALLMRSPTKAAIVAALFMLLGENYAVVESVMTYVLPRLKYWHTVSIAIFVLLHVAWVVKRFLKDSTAKDIRLILCIAFGVLIVVNVGISAPKIYEHYSSERRVKEQREATLAERVETSKSNPNMYLLLFDEYSNFPQMQTYYNYENKPLKDFLTDNNFSISYTSHNESIVSATIQANIANLAYVVDGSFSASERTEIRKNGALFSLMREHGYDVQIFETGDSYGGSLPSGTHTTGAVTVNGENLSQVFFKRSIAYPFIRNNTETTLRDIHEIVDYMSSPDNLPSGSTFTLVYLCFPHQPFVVDENGDPVSEEHMIDWENDQYYLGQFKYATKLMLQILDNIVTNDPQSIIVLQSDHGARARASSLFGIKFPWEVMNNPLDAVYYQGKNVVDVEGLSSVNTLRVVLNELFDLDFEILPVPNGTETIDRQDFSKTE